MSRANAAQDFLPASRNNPDLHFDAERLVQGRTLLVGALRETLVAATAFESALARQRLGAALHALQVTEPFSLPPLLWVGGAHPVWAGSMSCVLQGEGAMEVCVYGCWLILRATRKPLV